MPRSYGVRMDVVPRMKTTGRSCFSKSTTPWLTRKKILTPRKFTTNCCATSIHPKMNIARHRLNNQQIAKQQFTSPGQLVAWLGAIQAQDFPGSKWSIGLRLPGATESDIEQAIADKTIVRTWPMRGTLHFVAAADVH